MTTTLATVVACGLVTVQDGGRRGYAAVGVPVAGPLHRERYEIASTLLVGSADGSLPALEVLDGSLVLAAAAPLVAVVVGPARCRVEHPGPRRPGIVAAGVVLAVAPGELLAVDRVGRGPVYVVVAGWTADRLLGSAATDTFGSLGGAVVRPGFAVSGDEEATPSRVGTFWRPVPDESGPLRVVLAADAADDVLAGPWRVASASRSGVRLVPDGDRGRSERVADRPSGPVVAGTVQRTPSGETVVLGPDGGLTGGYDVTGAVASVDLDRLALLAPGDVTAFAPVAVDEAVRAYQDRRARVRRSYGHPDLVG